MAEHDQGYKLLFSHPEMVADLIRGFVDEPWVRQLDFSTLERVPGSYVSDDLRERLDDMIWRLAWGERQLYVYLLLEFQSAPDRFMALRLLVYVGLLLQDLAESLAPGPGERLPPVLPLVLYNGTRRWTAPRQLTELIVEVPGLSRYQPRFEYLLIDESRYPAEQLAPLSNLVAALFRLEQSRRPEEVQQVVAVLAEWLGAEEQRALRRHFLSWLTRVLLPGKIPGATLADVDDLGEFQTMLERRVQEWTREWERQGLEKGLAQGLEKGLEQGIQRGEATLLLRQLERRFGPVGEEVKARIAAAAAERLLDWGERLLTARRLEEVFS